MNRQHKGSRYLRGSGATLLVGVSLLFAVLCFPRTVSAQDQFRPVEEFREFLRITPADVTTRFSSLQEIQSRRSDLRIAAADGVVLDLAPYLESRQSPARIAEVLRDRNIDPEPRVEIQVLEYDDRIVIKQEVSYRGDARLFAEQGERLADEGILCYLRKDLPPVRPEAPSREVVETIAQIRRSLGRVRESPIAGYSIDELRAMDDARLFAAALNGGEHTVESYLMIPKVIWTDMSSIPPRRPGTDFLRSRQDFRLSPQLVPKPAVRDETRIAPQISIEREPISSQPEPLSIQPDHPSIQGDVPRIPSDPVSDATAILEILAGRTERDEFSVYLVNGFTWGRNYAWSTRVGTCINIPFVGRRCLYAEPYAEVEYGLGLRIPLRLDLTVDRTFPSGSDQLQSLRVVADLSTIDAGPVEYGSAGMPSGKILEGREAIAEVGATVGLRYDILGRRGNLSHPASIDLFDSGSRGNFVPPMPDGPSVRLFEVFSPDLSGGRCSLRFVGVTFHAGVRADMNCLGLHAELAQPAGERGDRVDAFPLTVEPTVIDGATYFSLSDVVYTANWELTPGLRIRGFIDVWVYSASFNWDLFLSRIAFSSPQWPFETHEGTTRGYRVDADADSVSPDPIPF